PRDSRTTRRFFTVVKRVDSRVVANPDKCRDGLSTDFTGRVRRFPNTDRPRPTCWPSARSTGTRKAGPEEVSNHYSGAIITPIMALSPGQTLGPYEIVAPLGAGGMGEVYRARDTRLERIVAIKILPAQLSSDPTRKHRFEREAKTISSLNHPHICVL